MGFPSGDQPPMREFIAAVEECADTGLYMAMSPDFAEPIRGTPRSTSFRRTPEMLELVAEDDEPNVKAEFVETHQIAAPRTWVRRQVPGLEFRPSRDYTFLIDHLADRRPGHPIDDRVPEGREQRVRGEDSASPVEGRDQEHRPGEYPPDSATMNAVAFSGCRATRSQIGSESNTLGGKRHIVGLKSHKRPIQ